MTANARDGPARSCTPRTMSTQPPAHDMPALLAAHPRRVDGTEVRERIDDAWCSVRSGVHRPGRRAHRRQGTVSTVLAEVALPGPIRSQHAAYGVHPALLDACFQSVVAHPDVQARSAAVPAVAVGCPPATRLRSYPQCPLLLHAGDQSRRRRGRGRPRCAGRARNSPADRAWGCDSAAGPPRMTTRDRVLGERLLTIEWQQRALPEVDLADAGAWLLISTSDTADVLATALTDALKSTARNALRCAGRSMPTIWPTPNCCATTSVPADSPVWSSSPDPRTATPMSSVRVRGGEYVHHLVRIARELPEIPGESPRLYLVTRNAQTVLPDDRGQPGAGRAAWSDAGDRH